MLFRSSGDPDLIRKIALAISRGSKNLGEYLDPGSTLEVSAALQYFLVRLRKPLIPNHIQALALDTSEGVQPETIAHDILGLIRQDVSGRQLLLIIVILDLLRVVRMATVGDELAGATIPITMLPIFFNIQVNHIPKWRTIAMVFMEMLVLSPLVLPLTGTYTSNQFSVLRIPYIRLDLRNMHPIQGEVLEINLVLTNSGTIPPTD